MCEGRLLPAGVLAEQKKEDEKLYGGRPLTKIEASEAWGTRYPGDQSESDEEAQAASTPPPPPKKKSKKKRVGDKKAATDADELLFTPAGLSIILSSPRACARR